MRAKALSFFSSNVTSGGRLNLRETSVGLIALANEGEMRGNSRDGERG